VSWSSFLLCEGLVFQVVGRIVWSVAIRIAFWGLRAQFPCQKVAMWGLSTYEWSMFFCTITTGSAYPSLSM
jgi:hypothetical protein